MTTTRQQLQNNFRFMKLPKAALSYTLQTTLSEYVMKGLPILFK